MTYEPFRLELPAARSLLRERLSEPAPARIQLLAGPRQVGKTTLLLELAGELGAGAIYSACDSPDMALPEAWRRLWQGAEDRARSGGKLVLFLDEAPHQSDWAARLKAEWDRIRRLRLPIHVVASGSSALRLAHGSKESLAGRFERIELAHWSARALAAEFRLPEEEAVELFVRRGAYPGAMPYREDPRRWVAYVHDAIIEPILGRDILATERVRLPALLREVFAFCAAAPAQIVTLQKLRGELHDAGALETVANYLNLLEEAFLVAAVRKHTSRSARRRQSPPKLITLNNAALAVADPRGVPDRERDPARFGAWVENAVLAHAWNQGLQVEYWREEPYEVDAVIESRTGKWAIEVKTGAVELRDLRALGEFQARFPGYRPLVLCEPAQIPLVERAGIEARDWRRFLLDGLA